MRSVCLERKIGAFPSETLRFAIQQKGAMLTSREVLLLKKRCVYICLPGLYRCVKYIIDHERKAGILTVLNAVSLGLSSQET